MKLFYISTEGDDLIAVTETGRTEAIVIWEYDFCHDTFYPKAGVDFWSLTDEERRTVCLKELIAIARTRWYDDLSSEDYVSIEPVTEIMDDTCVILAEYDEDEENEETRELRRMIDAYYESLDEEVKKWKS